jgi:hypothetical protein
VVKNPLRISAVTLRLKNCAASPAVDKPKGVDWSWPGRIMLAKMPNTFASVFKITPGES